MFHRALQGFGSGLGCNAGMSNPEYERIWRKMRLCWAPCLGHQPQRVENLAGFGGFGIPTASVTYGDGYPYRYVEIGTAPTGHTLGVQMTSSNGSLDLSNGYILEGFAFLHVDTLTNQLELADVNFGATGGAGIVRLRNDTRNLTGVRTTAATATFPTGTTFPNKFLHFLEVCPNRNINTANSHRISGFLYPTGEIATGVGNFPGTATLTYANFSSVTMGGKSTFLAGYPSRWSFMAIYEYDAGYELLEFTLKRFRDPFALFGLNARRVGQIPSAVLDDDPLFFGAAL